MRRIDIETGFQCNNYCKFCIQGEKRFKEPDKTKEEIKNILKNYSNDFNSVAFMGGEVTIRSDIFELISFAKRCGYEQIQVQTNGRMFFYIDFCKKIIEAGANEFVIAINGSTENLHDDLTRTNGSFKQTLQGICNLKELNQKVITNTVVTKKNYKDLQNIAKLLINTEVSKYQFAFMHINPFIQNNKKLINEIVPKYSEVKQYVEEAIEMGLDSNIRVLTEAFPFCTLDKKYQKYIFKNSTRKIESSKSIKFKETKRNEEQAKDEKCKNCKLSEKCEGPQCAYAEIFGFEEFIPIKK